MKVKIKGAIILALLLFLIIFEVSYALTNGTLTVVGTAKINGTLNVVFGEVNSSSNVMIDLSDDNRTMNITNVFLNKPGESVTIDFKIKNLGTSDAILDSFVLTGNDDPDILITFPDFQEGELLTALTGERVGTIVITWNPTSYVGEKTVDFSAVLNYKQSI